MAIILNGNIQYYGTKPLDNREFFETKQEMLDFEKQSIANGQITFCQEDKKHYKFVREDVSDGYENTGSWVELTPPHPTTSGNTVEATILYDEDRSTLADLRGIDRDRYYTISDSEPFSINKKWDISDYGKFLEFFKEFLEDYKNFKSEMTPMYLTLDKEYSGFVFGERTFTSLLDKLQKKYSLSNNDEGIKQYFVYGKEDGESMTFSVNEEGVDEPEHTKKWNLWDDEELINFIHYITKNKLSTGNTNNGPNELYICKKRSQTTYDETPYEGQVEFHIREGSEPSHRDWERIYNLSETNWWHSFIVDFIDSYNAHQKATAKAVSIINNKEEIEGSGISQYVMEKFYELNRKITELEDRIIELENR